MKNILISIFLLSLLWSCSDATTINTPKINRLPAVPSIELNFESFELAQIPLYIKNSHISKYTSLLDDAFLKLILNASTINSDHDVFKERMMKHKEYADYQLFTGHLLSLTQNNILTFFLDINNEKFKRNYTEIWCLKLNKNNQLLNIVQLGVSGSFSYQESGQEEGFEYEINYTETEAFEAFFNSDTAKIQISRKTIRKGFDWRIDQNLTINDSTCQKPIEMTYHI